MTSSHLSNALKITLGKGEAEAITLSVQMNCPVITDDKQARSTGETMGLHVVGAMGLLIRAKQAGIVDKIKPIIEVLEENRFRIGRTLREYVLQIAGELDD